MEVTINIELVDDQPKVDMTVKDATPEHTKALAQFARELLLAIA